RNSQKHEKTIRKRVFSDVSRMLLSSRNEAAVISSFVSIADEMSENRKSYKVLSIQSHVVSGYVGNKCAAFPLQVLGFEVDALNSVQYSNHKGYAYCKGHALTEDDLRNIFDGLTLNNLRSKYSHILTGYVGVPGFLNEVYAIVKELKQCNPKLIFVCDPVMGDNGKMYVDPDLLPIYRDRIVPLADIVTPNQFEAELLTGIKIEKESDALQAMDILHESGAKVVVISSTNLGDTTTLIALASINKVSQKQRFRIRIAALPVSFVGTGDLFAALLLAWLTKTDYDLRTSLENTVSTMQDVLKRTYNYALNTKEGLTRENLELKLIQSISNIKQPQTEVASELITEFKI
ncbi:pyridoxal kinase-like protein, partial [Leptotrombidium deliense]